MKLLYLLLILSLSPLSALPFTSDLMQEGHSVFITKSADETHEWKLRLIKEAKSSLEISTGYCLGQVFEELLEAVSHKLEENSEIRIHMLLFQMMGFISDSDIAFLDSLKEHYPGRFDYVITEETGLINQNGKVYITENHIKLIIVDEKYFLLGGTNLIDNLSTSDPSKYPLSSIPTRFMPRAASDMDAIICGPMAKKLRQEYFDLFAAFKNQEPVEQQMGEFTPRETAYFPIHHQTAIPLLDTHDETAHDAKVYAIIAGPRMRLHTIGNMYEHAILNAEISIDIGSMYFFPRSSIYEALIKASSRGCFLRIVTNGPHDDLSTNNSTRSLYGHINRLNYFPVMAGRHFKFYELFTARDSSPQCTQVYELNLPGVLLHKKVMTVDNCLSIIGSYNLGMKSEDAAYEVAAIIESGQTATQINDVLINDFANSTQVSYFQAMGWYFNPYYSIAETFEKKFLDGLLL